MEAKGSFPSSHGAVDFSSLTVMPHSDEERERADMDGGGGMGWGLGANTFCSWQFWHLDLNKPGENAVGPTSRRLLCYGADLGNKILQRFGTRMVNATDERIKEEHSSLKIQHKIQKNWVT